MIARISGTIVSREQNFVVLETGNGLSYQVLVPQIVAKAMETKPLGESLTLETIYYLSVEQTRATPILIGFQNAIEKEFFEKLLTVPRIGPRAALGVFARSVSTIARAIETADFVLLQSLPGVGKQKARDLVAALQGKVAKFALMQDADLERQLGAPPPMHNVGEEALQLLMMLGHKRADAERLVSEAFSAEPSTPDAETLVRVIYRKQQEKK
jgi:Holliday junction DNA helicase RuvA